MENTSLVSIALCTYNGAKYLSEQLDTLVKQTYGNIEIIAIDDCSTDNTFAILEEYAQRFTFLKVLKNERNIGYIKNFEKAILLCKGDFIALSDQDDIWDLEKIRLQVENIEDNLLIYHDSEFIAENGTLLNKKMSNIINMYEGNSWKPFLLYNCISGHSILIKTELAKFFLPFDKNEHHDQQIAFVAGIFGKIRYLNFPLVKYRQHNSSSTDILGLRKQEATELIHKTRLINWLTFCETKKGLIEKNNSIIPKLYQFTIADKETYFRYKEFLFLLKNYDKLLYIKKKGNLSKYNIILKRLWGIKTKRIWKRVFYPSKIRI